MPWRLRDNLYWCVSGGRAIFLDIEADRYFCLSPAADATFRAFAAGDRPGKPDSLQLLLERQLLIEAPEPADVRPCTFVSAVGDFFPHPASRPTLPAMCRVFTAELKIKRLLRTKPLLDVIKHVALGSPAHQGSTESHDLDNVVRAIAAASLLFGATDRCLVRALAAQRICRSLGLTTRLVFGVRTNPFGAHAWVQSGELVIVGDFEQVRLYTPIAAFG